ncbi:TetR/AcrR family transcriptional regulator [uncultured Rhodoferax sp.]|uniref:TetR/AcrR family transcriptional regulator n=1 Tax=uncultured Rhodoferax sp. TaxID=223188 RepID=UPI0025DF4100|nr:TetR/AcrR family transcriptional regulator [uncultured Rhodoferax sp.]
MDTELSPKATEIVACARALLAAGGYNGFSYADISAAVNISKPSIHHHFASKAELVRVVLVRYRAETLAGIAAMEQQITDPVAQLQAYTDYWAACIREGSLPFCVCAMLAAELPAIPAEVADEVRGHFSELSAWLTSVLAKGAAHQAFFLQATAEEEARTFMATVHGAMLSARAFGDAQMFPRIVQPLLRRLTSH